MKTLCKSLAVLAVFAVSVPLARAAEVDVPNINKRGEDEKAFAAKMATAITNAARSSIKTTTLDSFEKKVPKEGQLEYRMKAGFKGAGTGKNYTANITVLIDTANKDKWEILRVDYDDDSKNVIGFSRKKVEEMRKKINGQ